MKHANFSRFRRWFTGVNAPNREPSIAYELLWMVGDWFRMWGQLIAVCLEGMSPIARVALLAFIFIGIGVWIS